MVRTRQKALQTLGRHFEKHREHPFEPWDPPLQICSTEMMRQKECPDVCYLRKGTSLIETPCQLGQDGVAVWRKLQLFHQVYRSLMDRIVARLGARSPRDFTRGSQAVEYFLHRRMAPTVDQSLE